MSQAILNCSTCLNFTGTAYNHYCTSTYLELYEVYSTLEKANHLNGELYHSSVICLVFYPLHLSCPFLQKETENIINIWKGKGANDALELSIQNILNWDVELEQSSSYVLTTATGEEKYYEDVIGLKLKTDIIEDVVQDVYVCFLYGDEKNDFQLNNWACFHKL